MNSMVNANDLASTIQDASSPWRAKWMALAPRERQLITVMAWLVGLILLIMVGIRPAWRTLQQTPDQIKQVDAVLDDMRRQADEVRQLRQLPAMPSAQAEAALYAATQRLGSSAQLRMQTDRATVTLVKVPGKALSDWLEEIRTSARVRPTEANLIQVVPGAYSGSLTLVLPLAAPSPR